MALIELVLELILIITVAVYWVWLYRKPDIQQKRSRFVGLTFLVGIACYWLIESYLRSVELAVGQYGAQRTLILFIIAYAAYRIILFLPPKLRKFAAIFCISVLILQVYVQIANIYTILFPGPVNCPEGVTSNYTVSFWRLLFKKDPSC